MRPVLPPAVRRLWRDRSTLQLGRGAAGDLVLEGLDPDAARALRLLDGTRTRDALLADPSAGPLLGLLERAGLVVDADELTAGLRGLPAPERDRLAPDAGALSLVRGPAASGSWQARRSARVLVRGAGRVGAPLAALLVAAGVGAVDVRDGAPTRPGDLSVGGLGPADVGRRRDEALTARLGHRPVPGPPDLVVLAGETDERQEQSAAGALLVAEGVPHLLVTADGRLGVVGPLVLPGHSACLRCLDLTRADLDPGWPAVSGQLATTAAAAACDGVLAVAVAAQAALQVLEHVDAGVPASAGGTLELGLPGWRWRRRSWPLHPDCGCSWVPARRAG